MINIEQMVREWVDKSHQRTAFAEQVFIASMTDVAWHVRLSDKIDQPPDGVMEITVGRWGRDLTEVIKAAIDEFERRTADPQAEDT